MEELNIQSVKEGLELCEDLEKNVKKRNLIKISFLCEKCNELGFSTYRTLRKNKALLCRKCILSNSFYKGDEKRKATLKEKYGVSNNLHIKEVESKIRNDWKSKYGVDNPAKAEVIKEKTKKTNLNKYGVNSPGQSKEIKDKQVESWKKHKDDILEKQQQTNIERYGVNWQVASEQTRKKIEKTLLDRYGKFIIRKFYFYDDNFFDSSWELYMYIWLKDSGIDFEFQPSYIFEYLGDDNKMHKYFPDFKIGDTYYDVKGGQLLNEKNEPYNRLSKKYWWEKYNACIEHGVKFLKFEDIKRCVEYVNSKYGNKFVKNCKVKSK